MKNLKCFLLKQSSGSVKFLAMLFTLILIYSSVPAQRSSEKKLPKEEQQINTDSILKIAHDALKNIDFDKINIELQSAMKVLDTLNINARIKEALANIDFSKARSGLDSAIKKMQSAEIKQQLELSRKQLIELQKNKNLLRKVDMEKIKKELKETQIQLEKMHKELKRDIKAGDADNTAFQMNFRDFNNTLPFIIL
jgi:tetratricopeptide (TPR) repeat protein